uniref:Uncharacterized protein n=1 Tax=Rhizophora mucronata TaxID=61149 RepID=A0A2P2L1W9_RHIMU
MIHCGSKLSQAARQAVYGHRLGHDNRYETSRIGESLFEFARWGVGTFAVNIRVRRQNAKIPTILIHI